MRRLPAARATIQQYADNGGELLVCPICWNARKLDQSAMVPNASLTGATPMFDWIGQDDAAIFSY